MSARPFDGSTNRGWAVCRYQTKGGSIPSRYGMPT